MNELRNNKKEYRYQKTDNRQNGKPRRSVFCLLFSIIFLFGVLISTSKVYAAINNTINFQSKIIFKSTGLNLTAGTPTCVSTGADTCDFRVRIWNISTGGTATAGNNLLYEELFNNVELGDTNGIFKLRINSVCGATANSTHQWGTTAASATVCDLYDDNADADSITGVNFDRNDLYLEITFDPSGSWTDLASPPGGIETFTRTPFMSLPSAFEAQTLSGISASGFVQLSPTSVQNTSSSTSAIWINQQGSGDLINLERTVGGQTAFKVDNNGQLTLGATSGTLLLGGDANLYRVSSTSQKTDDNLIIGGSGSTSFTVLGYSEFKGNLKAILTVSNGSTTTTGSGSSVNTLTVSSTSNFDIGNVVLINGSTYARIISIDSSTQMSVTPAVSWSAGQSVVEYIAPKIGGDGSDASLLFDKIYATNGLRVGYTTEGTVYQDQLISPGISRDLRINSGKTINLSSNDNTEISTTNGLIVNKAIGQNTSQSWSTGNTGGTARGHAVSVGYNGKWYMWGGANATPAIVNTMDIYDFTTGVWSTGTSGGTGRGVALAFAYNDKMYVLTGCTNVTCSAYTTVVDIYDFKTNTWSTGTSGGTGRAGAMAVLRNGKIYIWGGCNGASCGTYLNTLDIYDIGANSWSTGTTGGTARAVGVAVNYNDKMYIWGGSNGTPMNTMDIYDFATNTWSTGTTGGTARIWMSASINQNKMYVYGGYTGATINSIDIYDFASKTWSTGTSGGTARNRYQMRLYDNKIYVWGGATDGSVGFINTMDIYDLGVNDTVLQLNSGDKELVRLNEDNKLTLTSKPLGLRYVAKDLSQYSTLGWSSGTTGGTGRLGAVSQVYNGKIYYWGGCTTETCSAITNTIDIYDIATDTWTTGTAGGTAASSPTSVLYNGKMYIFGGCTTAVSTCTTVGGQVSIYDISTDSWTTGTTGGNRGQVGGAVVYNGKVYMHGGWTGAAQLNTTAIYDIASDSWSTGSNGVATRRQSVVALYNGKMYEYGGYTGSATAATLYIYDIATDSWTTGTAGTSARRLTQPVIYNNKMYIIGGYISSGTSATLIWDFDRQIWLTGTAALTTRYSHAVNIYNNKIYLWSGTNGSTPQNTVEIYDLGTSTADDVFYMTNSSNSGPNDGKLFRFDTTGRAYSSEQGGWFSVGADYAEYMHTNDTSIEPGDIVKLDLSDGKSVLKASSGDTPLGVISTQPGFVGNITTVEDINNNRSDMKLLSMVGQVPVKVIGDISVGDKITVSNIQGIGRKAEPGEPNIGIAQDMHTGNSIGFVSVLITRNNDGINNKLQIDLGQNSDGGFRLSSEGKMQYKDSKGDWANIASEASTDPSITWEQIGDSVINANNGVTSIGVAQSDLDSSKLQVDGDIEIKDGLKFIKLSAINSQILINSQNTGFKVENGSLEFQDPSINNWIGLSKFVTSLGSVNADGSIQEVKNAEQVSGWGYIKGDSVNQSLTKLLSFGKTFSSVPVVIVDISGSTDSDPQSLNDCKFDDSIVTMTPYSIDNSQFKLNIQTDGLSKENKFYCFAWRAVGSN